MKGQLHASETLADSNAWQNYAMMSEFMTDMGRIKHSRMTGLRPKNQRRIAKAIRRSIALGLMPSVHKHPHILAAEAAGQMYGYRQ